ncbi:MAG TPA: hypothetical protein VNF29_08155 [Candidatus Binataceae bacterium]|nr:hypothetical protein [Candidatus Binataceae bacterium]
MEAQAQRLGAHISCSVCLHEGTPTRAQVFVVVGREYGDPAVMGFCDEHAPSPADAFSAPAIRAAQAKSAPYPQATPGKVLRLPRRA